MYHLEITDVAIPNCRETGKCGSDACAERHGN